jgi:predicted permease
VQNIYRVDRGFDDQGLILSSFDLSIQGYSESSGRQLYESVLNRILSIPGVEAASLAKTVPPYDWSDRVSIFYEGEHPTADEYKANWELGLRVDADRVAPDYFRTMGIPLLAGRDFTAQDRPESSPAAIISQGLAERLWPGEPAIGKRVVLPSEPGAGWRPVEIVGIAKEVRYRSLTVEPPYLIYLPESQNYDGRATLVVRSSLDPLALLPAIRSEVARLDPDLPLYRSITMSQQIADSLWRQRMAEWLLGAVALLALALVGIGLYCVVAHYASERTREFGIRIALGATASDVVRLMLRRSATIGAVGMCAGIAVSPVLIRLLEGTLYNVTAYDPPMLMASALVIGAVVSCAGLLPARRAGRTDPMEVMKCE